ncbi:MAG: hypothetical protein NTV06_07315 [candidate division Zixibacteria bacterium]|nr:hypothetical protein [candidate division Zixibacteria bacterium]
MTLKILALLATTIIILFLLSTSVKAVSSATIQATATVISPLGFDDNISIPKLEDKNDGALILRCPQGLGLTGSISVDGHPINGFVITSDEIPYCGTGTLMTLIESTTTRLIGGSAFLIEPSPEVRSCKVTIIYSEN